MRAMLAGRTHALCRATTVALLLALPAVAVAGCGGDEQTESKPAPETEPEPSDEPVIEAALDVPPPAPPWAPGVTVVDAGNKPAVLGQTPDLGAARPYVIVVEASRTPKKRARRWPKVRLTGSTTLTSASPDASRRTVKVERVDIVPTKPFDETVITTLTTQLPASADPAELVADEYQAVESLAWPEAPTDPLAVEIGQAVSHALSHLTLPLPTDPVGKKGAIEVRRPITLMGLPMQQTLRLDVRAVAGKQLEVAGDVTYDLDPDAEVGGAMGLASVAEAHGEGKFFLRLHQPSAFPIEMNVVVDLVVKSPDGKQEKTWLDLRVDEDYLAQEDNRVRLVGEFTQGGIVIGHVAPGTKVWLNKSARPVSKEGDFVLGFGHRAKDRALLGLSFPGAERERHIVHVAPREFPEERIDGLPPEMVELDKETKRALAKSRRAIKKVREKVTRKAMYAGGFRWPLKGRVTSTYGRNRILNGEEKGPHWGVDLAAGVGTKVKAPAAGVVVYAEKDVPLSGHTMIIDHGHGLTSTFLHLQGFKVEVGTEVKAGQVVATSGNSGRSTGPHLDWRMNLGSRRVDPETIVGKKVEP